MNERWINYFMDLCRVTAQMSYDPSTKVGAVIVRPNKTVAAMAFNGFPRGCDDHPELYANREVKYSRVLHAEVNAILHAREPLHGCALFIHPFPPCDRCAAQIIQAGIKYVVAPPLPEGATERWEQAVQRAMDMFQETGVWFGTPEEAAGVFNAN